MTAVPGLAAFLCNADNATHGSQEAQTSIQTLRQIFMELQASHAMAPGQPVDPGAIAARIGAQRPKLTGQCRDIANLVDAFWRWIH